MSWQEERTTDVVFAWMDKLGLSPQRFEGTGLSVDLGPSGGPIVALRADLDALPLLDTTQDPWRSKNPGVAHACGHDVHISALIGAATALAEADRQIGLPARVRLIFQPAEEVMPGGALRLLSDGALAGVSRIFALHCDPSLDVGRIGIREGAITGASDQIHVVLSGRGGHTSRPHLTEDLTFALGSLITQLPAVLSRRFDPRAGASLVWGRSARGTRPTSSRPSASSRARCGCSTRRRGTRRSTSSAGSSPTSSRRSAWRGPDYTRGVPPVVNDSA